MKNMPRLDYERLADALVDRGLVDREAIQLVLQQSAAAGIPFPEALVRDSLVSDWEVSRVAAEVFNLPFVTVDVLPPADDVTEGMDPEYLCTHILVPLERFGDLLTVAMPGIVPTAVLSGLGMGEDTTIIPVVGTVATNRHWLEEKYGKPKAELIETFEPVVPAEGEEGWTNIFDAGDEAVHLNLQDDDLGVEGFEGLEGLDADLDAGLDL